jgi:hypothetical protein
VRPAHRLRMTQPGASSEIDMRRLP